VTEAIDVFLNQCGPDVMGGFIAYLYDALEAVGLNAFLDKKSLVKGSLAFTCIDVALKGARIHVAVVSRGYMCGIEVVLERIGGRWFLCSTTWSLRTCGGWRVAHLQQHL
jgi:hypothetical protein